MSETAFPTRPLFDRDFSAEAPGSEAASRAEATIDLFTEDDEQQGYLDDVKVEVEHETMQAVATYTPDKKTREVQIIEGLGTLTESQLVQDVAQVGAAQAYFRDDFVLAA